MNELLRSAVPLLLEWYFVSKRDLPWRGTHDPYRVWISEIMLQQTRVEAVKDYYRRFLALFPTVEDLAAASEEEVLKAWEGLGYYSRARNLRRAAKLIAEGGFPKDFEGVRALPGVGDYTAGAICSIAYDLPCPAVDGNVLRVLTRLNADGRKIDDQRVKADFARELKEVYPREAGDFCQALMELGAIVCVPNGAPTCEICPWRNICRAHLAGMEEEFPVREEKKGRKVISVTVLVLKCGDKFALEKRPDTGLLASLWQFPLFEGNVSPEEYGKVCKKQTAKHIFTHIEWHMTGYFVEVGACDEKYTWASAEEIRESYALPSALKAFIKWLDA